MINEERNFQFQHTDTRAARIKELVQANRTGITPQALMALENTLNKVWTRYGIYFVLTGTHVIERLPREEHQQSPITLHELTRLFMEFTRKYSWYFARLPVEAETYGVIKEPFSQINVGFVVRPGVGISGYPRDLMLQTILRKREFSTRNRIFEV